MSLKEQVNSSISYFLVQGSGCDTYHNSYVGVWNHLEQKDTKKNKNVYL